MGDRYYITGVQLGMLIALEKPKRKKLVDEIVDKQFLANKEGFEMLLRKYGKADKSETEEKK